MKKKWIFSAIIAVLVIIAITIAVLLIVHKDGVAPEDEETDTTKKTSVTETNPPESAVSITEDCWEHVTNMTTEAQADGNVSVMLTAPDYVALINLLAEKNTEAITPELLEQAVEENPTIVKEYTFTTSSAAENDVKDALIEQITFELVAHTLEDMNG